MGRMTINGLVPPLLAEATTLLEQAHSTSEAISAGFNELWTEVLNGGLYEALCDVGVLFAVATLVLFMVRWTKAMLNDESSEAFSELIWPLIVGIFLFNNGALLAQSTLVMRDYINSVNNYVLEYTAATTGIREAYEEANQWGLAETFMGSMLRDCTSGDKTQQETLACLQEVQANLEEVRDELREFRGNDGSWWAQASERIGLAIQAVQEGGGNWTDVLLSGFSSTIGATLQTGIRILLIALNQAYQWGIELSMILTALVGPMAMGGTLLPTGAKPLLSWLSGFFALGMAKLSLNILMGLAGLLIVTADANQPMFFLVFIGVTAPFLSAGIAAAGGMAAFAGLARGATFMGGMTVGTTVGVARIVAARQAVARSKK